MITGHCKSCTPCEGCNPDQIILPQDMVNDGIKPCDVCDPCNSNQICSYCGNGFCRCDPIIETEDGPMHKGCAEQV